MRVILLHRFGFAEIWRVGLDCSRAATDAYEALGSEAVGQNFGRGGKCTMEFVFRSGLVRAGRVLGLVEGTGVGLKEGFGRGLWGLFPCSLFPAYFGPVFF